MYSYPREKINGLIDTLRFDILGVDIVGVDIVGVDIVDLIPNY